MNEFTDLPEEGLQPIGIVVEAILSHAEDLKPSDILVVGAACRDVHHGALGYRFAATATYDLDLALALESWDAYRALSAAFPKMGSTGIRFLIAGVTVDLVPFGMIEEPDGKAQPPTRQEGLSVWAFREIFDSAVPLLLPTGAIVKVPTVAGYAAAKLGAWLDRSEWHESKDAADLALVLYWYGDAESVHDRLYETEQGQDIFVGEAADLQLAACRLLGRDIATTIGAARLAELLDRWPGDLASLVQELSFAGAPWPAEQGRRTAIIDALTRGLTDLDG